MNKTTTKRLPHGTIPFMQIRDAQLRDVLMKIGENEKALDARLATVERVQNELQKKRRA